MIPISHQYWQAAREGRQEVVLSVITTPRGRYLQSNVWPSETLQGYFGGVYFWDGTRSLGDGGTWGGIPISDVGNRLLNPGSLKETLAPIHGNLPVSLGQTERGAVAVEYDNRDRYFCHLFGDQRDEPFLFQTHDLYHGFLGLDPQDFVKVFSGEITQIRYTAQRAIIVAEAQASVFDTVEVGTPYTAYALSMSPIGTETHLLLQSDSTDGNTTITDASTYGRTITNTGSPYVQHKTAQAKWGATSLKSDGTNGYLSLSSFTLSQNELMVDFWMYFATHPSGWNHSLFQLGTLLTAYTDYLYMLAIHPYTLRVTVGEASGTSVNLDYDATGEIGSGWTYVKVIAKDGTLSLYLDGGLKDTADVSAYDLTTFAGTSTVFTSSGSPVVFQGYLDEFHVTDVVANETDVPTGPYLVPADIPTAAQATFTHAEVATVFFARDDWTCTINFTKTALNTPGVLFLLENNGSTTTLEIGVDVSNYLYVTTGQDVEGTPATTTYTDTQALTTAMIAGNLNAFIRYSHTDSEITFRINGTSNTQAATAPYDRTGTNAEQVTLGKNWGGQILNVKFNETFFATNNLGSDALTVIPDVIGGHNLTVHDASWEAWG